jgi:nucleotide-binding universal stress UspA family protein
MTPEPQTNRRRSGRWVSGAAGAAVRPLPDPPLRILLASTGAPFSPEALRRTIELATPERATITVLSIARVYGTSLGLPHPGLQPTPQEWEEQRQIVNQAAKTLSQQGFEVRVQVARARNGFKMIARWANARHVHAIVLGAPELPRWRRVIEGDPAREIGRRCDIPIHLVPTRPASGRNASRH